ncbi:MAG: RnfH family protein [Betaproteobacteria bacterium]|nr:RnfH family protein [Betaproteobacteria bacterium]
MSTIRVVVAWGDAYGQHEVALSMAPPATLQQAIDRLVQAVPAAAGCIDTAVAFGMWGKVRTTDHVLRDGDRVEIYRALKADPKDVRRANAANRRSAKM